MYDILIFNPIATFCTHTSMSISSSIKLVAKSGQCLYNIQYRQDPWWGCTTTNGINMPPEMWCSKVYGRESQNQKVDLPWSALLHNTLSSTVLRGTLISLLVLSLKAGRATQRRQVSLQPCKIKTVNLIMLVPLSHYQDCSSDLRQSC